MNYIINKAIIYKIPIFTIIQQPFTYLFSSWNYNKNYNYL